MTVKSDVVAITPTSTAVKAFAAAGSNFSVLLGALQQQAAEMQQLVKQLIAYHPTDQVLTVTLHAGGSGGSNGPVTITGTTGTGKFYSPRHDLGRRAASGAHSGDAGQLHSSADIFDSGTSDWRQFNRRAGVADHDRRFREPHGVVEHFGGTALALNKTRAARDTTVHINNSHERGKHNVT